MSSLLIIVIWVMLFVGMSCLLERSLFRTLLGVLFLSHAANLIIFLFTGPKKNSAAIMGPETQKLSLAASDPLAQALILTAIVIGFGFLAFLLALAREAYSILGSDNLEAPPKKEHQND